MYFTKTKKLIAAVLTAAMAMSPVFMMPSSASDGQDVEDTASSWRYQDGDIVVEEGLNPFEADAVPVLSEEPEEQDEAVQEEYDVQEDQNAQMGNSVNDEAVLSGQTDETDADLQAQQTDPVVGEESEEIVSTEEPQEDTGLQSDEPAEDQAKPDSDAQSEMTPEETVETPEQEIEAPEQEVQTPEQEVQTPVEELNETEEPEIIAMSSTSRNRYWTWSGGKYRRGPGYLKGIDVSYWQGKIDWKKVKAAGVDFAIIRCGYGPNTSSKDDSKFAANVKGCVANGIPYGVYLYSYANSVSKAKDEADHAIRLLKANNCKLKYPIYYDLEDRKVSKAGSGTICKMAYAFCSKLKKAGYPSGVYANLNWWNNKLYNFSGYDRWVAQWGVRCTYKKAYSIWQCTSSTHVNGIKGRVDANLLMCTKSSMENYMKKMKSSVVTYGFRTINGKKYIYSSRGTRQKNCFVWVDDFQYAVNKDGIVQKGKKYTIGNRTYILDSQGRAYRSKVKALKKAAYYETGKGERGKVKKGQTFYIIRYTDKWAKMTNGYWIERSKIKATIVYPIVTPSVKVNYKAKLKKKTRSRSGPSTDYVKTKKFKKNTTVTVIGTYNGWSKLSSGQWLPSSRLKRK